MISTYNGEAFLAAQLDSIVGQKGVDVQVFARDDGSHDSTIGILKEYAGFWPSLATVGSAPNIRPAASFLKLLEDVPDIFDYYAFCDQDDIWLPDKLRYATEKLSGLPVTEPALYCSRAICVDRDLTRLGETILRGTGKFEELIFANIVAGNTLVMNNAGALLVRSQKPDRGVIMHDWWCALVVSAFGTILCDERPTLLYRQHVGNVQGTAPGRIPMLLMQLGVFLRNPSTFYPIGAQMAEFLRLYGAGLGSSNRKAAEALVNSRRTFATRLGYAAFGNIPRWDLFGSVGTRVLIAAGWY
jgi:glycosyltransferase involved in cell wall biosynthesis